MIFENHDVRCPENPQRYLFGLINTLGHHDLEVVEHKPWGSPSWCKYEVTLKCKRCGARLNRFGIDESTMIRAGIIDTKV